MLQGKWFIGFRLGKAVWQGEILEALTADRYLIRLFSWHDGSTNQAIVSLDQMSNSMLDADRVDGWRFYDTPEDFQAAVEDVLPDVEFSGAIAAMDKEDFQLPPSQN